VIEVRLLGPVEVVRGDEAVAIGGPRQRALLALLALQAGRIVPIEAVIEQLWAGEPPDGAEVTIRSYVSRLRAALGSEVEIGASGPGYILRIEADRIDIGLFERLIKDAEAALAGRRARVAANRASEALRLWRGRPFGELGDDGVLQGEADRLEERRLRGIELRIEAELALGQGPELVDELERLVREHPYREAFWRQLMLGLYRSQRQADALAAYRRARSALDEELGIEPGAELQALEAAILRHEVPAPDSAEIRHNLPEPATTFIGREAELSAVSSRVVDARLVTLVGVGGVGKTRLAIEVARSLLDLPADGVFFVDLAPLSDGALIAGLIGSLLGIREEAGIAPLDRLVDQLRGASTLIVLDNCEHLSEAAAEVAARLLEACPDVRILATSREILGVPGETVVAVPPLSLPDSADPGTSIRTDAVELFLVRARSARTDLVVDDEAVATAARICADLDGLPLAIELAAARARALSLGEIAERLGERFRFLVSWRKLTTARHRTLREAMDWSYQLLGSQEQALLRHLAVFAGRFDLEAVAAVGVDGDQALALDLIERLVEASLVGVEDSTLGTWYRLLETVRQYAEAQLIEAGERGEARRRHAEHYAAWIERLFAPLRILGKQTPEYEALIGRNRDNLRAALTWCRESGSGALQLQLAEPMWFHAYLHGELTEERMWLESALGNPAGAPPRLVAYGQAAAAGLAWMSGELDHAVGYSEAALAGFADLGEPIGESNVHNVLGLIALSRGDYPRAEEHLRRFMELRQEHDHDPTSRHSNLGVALNNLAEVALAADDFAEAEARYRESRDHYEANGDATGVAMVELNRGVMFAVMGQLDDARQLLGRYLADTWHRGATTHLPTSLEGVATIANASGQHHTAIELLGGASALRERISHPPLPWNIRHIEVELEIGRAALGPDTADAAYDEGRQLGNEAIVERALAVLAG
jgi:predicted ATPase/DNA-binding SARP family transcriptional activator